MLAVMCNEHIGSLYQQKSNQHSYFPIQKMGVNGASTIIGVVNIEIGK
jgi:hypothetical protein